MGGIWSLYLTGTTFSIAAAVGFISLYGIAIMEGLLMISYFNALRREGLPLNEAIPHRGQELRLSGVFSELPTLFLP